VFKTAAIVCFLFCTVFWFIFRNICIPLACWDLWLYLKYPEELSAYQNGPLILALFTSVLCVMHVYWFGLFISMLVNAIRNGTSEDGQRTSLNKDKKSS
jgi:hypothetical protein